MISTPFPEKYTFFGEKQAEQLTNDTIDICIELNAKHMRITQFCMMRGPMPFYDQFKGIIKALTQRHDSLVDLVYFDVPEDKWMDLKTLFESYNVADK
jgi:hypothetical protein